MNYLENDADFCRNSITYLHNVSMLPEINVPALKSFYSTKRRLMELRKCILLPSSITRTSITCQRCLINLQEGPANYKVVPAKKHSDFAKKILAKQRSGKPLTKFQQKYIDRLSSFSGNHLAITCKFCKNEAFIKMQKPKKEIKRKVLNMSKSKKKKRKDKFCGLKKDAVLSLAVQNAKKKLNHLESEINLTKKKKKRKLNDINLEPISSLTPQNVRNLDHYEEIERRRPKLKINRAKEVKILEISKENLLKNKHKLKKKRRNLNKLGVILNKSDNAVKTSISNLKQFLQGL